MYFLENCKFDLHEISHRCSASVQNFAISFREVKVEVQGQNRRRPTEPAVITRMQFKICIVTGFGNLGSNLSMKYVSLNSRWRPVGGLPSLECFLFLFVYYVASMEPKLRDARFLCSLLVLCCCCRALPATDRLLRRADLRRVRLMILPPSSRVPRR